MVKYNPKNLNTEKNEYSIPCRRKGTAKKLQFLAGLPFATYPDGTFWYDQSKSLNVSPLQVYGCLYRGKTEDIVMVYPKDCDPGQVVFVSQAIPTVDDEKEPNEVTFTYFLTTTNTIQASFINKKFSLAEKEIETTVDLMNIPFNDFNCSLEIVAPNGINSLIIGIYKSDEDISLFLLERDNNGKFKYDIATKCAIGIMPMCSSETQSYCLFNLPQTNGKYKLYRYGSIDAIEPLSDSIHFGKGVYNGIVKIGEDIPAWKSWEGPIESEIVSDIDVKFVIYKDKTIISFLMNNQPISYSSYNIGLDIYKAMKVLGINATQYSRDVCEFFDDGRVVANAGYDDEIRKAFIETKTEEGMPVSKQTNENSDFMSNEGAKWIFGIDAEYQITVNTISEDYHTIPAPAPTATPAPEKPQNTKLIVIIVVVVVVVVIIGVIICCCCCKKKKEGDDKSEEEVEV